MIARKALVIGINYYQTSCLHGCVNDAQEVAKMLSRNPADDSVNFGIEKYLAKDQESAINNADLRGYINKLFNQDKNIEAAFLYFSGHGATSSTGGYLCGSDCKQNDYGMSLNDMILLANKCPANNKIIMLDSCYSGIAAASIQNNNISEIGNGVTILTASTDCQYATEQNGCGLFTSLLVDAFEGAAANLLGEITPGSIYAHIDQSLGAGTQRPVFKTNVEYFVSLRKVPPALPKKELLHIAVLFPPGHDEYFLNPTYERDDSIKTCEEDKAISEHVKIFDILQHYDSVNLVRPVGATRPFFAAMNKKSMKLTRLGKHYRKLVAEGLI